MTETKAKHTPGPWKIERIGSRAFNVRAGEDSLAQVYAHIGSLVFPDKEGQGEANARLFSAAPDLLKQLKKAVELLEPFDDPGLSLGLGTNVLPDMRAALAKAEDGQ